MKNKVQNLLYRLMIGCIYLVIGSLIALLAIYLQSNFLQHLYTVSLLSILLAFTAISFAMYSFIANKLIDLNSQFPNKFVNTGKELFFALKTEVFLLGILVLLLIGYDSPVLLHIWRYFNLLIGSCINAVIICFIHILYDLGKTTYYIYLYIRS